MTKELITEWYRNWKRDEKWKVSNGPVEMLMEFEAYLASQEDDNDDGFEYNKQAVKNMAIRIAELEESNQSRFEIITSLENHLQQINDNRT